MFSEIEAEITMLGAQQEDEFIGPIARSGSSESLCWKAALLISAATLQPEAANERYRLAVVSRDFNEIRSSRKS